MKQLLVTFLLLVMAIGLSAQTGLFGISFGQSRDNLEKMLKDKGFKIEVNESGQLLATNPKIKGLMRIEINLSTGKTVLTWDVFYDLEGNPELAKQIKDELYKLHGEAPIWDDYYEELVWELDNEMGAYLGEDEKYLRVSYYEFDYEIYDYLW